MRKIISKILIIFIIIVILFEFTCSSNICYALTFDTTTINDITNLMGGIVSIVLWIPRILVTGMAWGFGEIMTKSLAESCGINDTGAFAGTKGNVATPFDIFFNKYKLFDVNYFDVVQGATGDDDNILNDIRTNVAQWFYIMRLIAVAVLLCVLIYVGIRMAISTIAEDKAKYKKMLVDWVCSLVLIFVLQYIAVFTIYANNAIVNYLSAVSYENIDQAIEDIMFQAMGGIGIPSIVATFVYCMIIFQTIAFMITYLQRMIKVGFLLIISPLISLTYSIDKMGDGKAQALGTWLKEFVYTILIQPFHCVMYLAFVNTAIRLLNTDATISSFITDFSDAFGKFNQLANGILVILCLKFINDGEKAIRKIFNFQDEASMTSMAAGAAVGMAALSSAKKIGSTTAKGINTARGIPSKFSNAIGKDNANGTFSKAGEKLSEAFKDTKVGKIANGIGSKVGDFNKKINNSAPYKSAQKAMESAGKFVGSKKQMAQAKINAMKAKSAGWKAAHPKATSRIKGATTLGMNAIKRSTPLAIGMMGAAMSYATGSSGLMQAVGVGSGMMKGSEELFASTQGTLEKDGIELIEKETDRRLASDEDYKETSEALKNTTENISKKNKELKKINQAIDKEKKNIRPTGNQTQDEAYKKYLEDWEKLQNLRMSRNSDDQSKAKGLEQSLKSRNPNLLKLLDNREEIKKEKIGLEKEQLELASKQENMRNKMRGDVYNNMKNNGTAQQLATAESEILKKIHAAMSFNKGVQEGEEDSEREFKLNDQEADTAKGMQQTIVDLVNRSLVGGGANFNASEFVASEFNLGMDNPIGESLTRAIEEYQFQKNASLYNGTVDNATKVGIDKDLFSDNIKNRMNIVDKKEGSN